MRTQNIDSGYFQQPTLLTKFILETILLFFIFFKLNYLSLTFLTRANSLDYPNKEFIQVSWLEQECD